MSDSRPSAPVSHANEAEHRRQLATSINLINQSTPDYRRTDSEISAGVTPVDYRYPPGDVRRYGLEPTYSATFTGDAGMSVTIYVDAANGDDTNNGSVQKPFRTIQMAANFIASHGPVIQGIWRIKLAAGSYAGANFVRRFITGNTRGLLVIEGPDVGGYPNVPTAVIDQSLSSATSGLAFGWLQQVIVRNIKTTGFAGTSRAGIVATRFCDIRLENVHDEGSYYGWRFNNNVTYTANGGILKDNVFAGIEELFQITRAIDQANKVQIVNPGHAGIYSKEFNCGHVDSLEIDGAGVTGLRLHSWITMNVGGLVLKRCPIGITATNAELHEENSIAWGTGAEACTRKYNLGPSVTLLSRTGWTGDAATYRSGSREPELRGHDYATHEIDDTSAHDFTLGTLYANEHSLEGQRVRVVVRGKRTVGSNGMLAIEMRFDSEQAAIVTLPTSGANAAFEVTFDVTTYADGDFQRVFAYGRIEGAASEGQSVDRTIDFSTDDNTVIVRVTQGHADDETLINELYFYA